MKYVFTELKQCIKTYIRIYVYSKQTHKSLVFSKYIFYIQQTIFFTQFTVYGFYRKKTIEIFMIMKVHY